jgi:hypothetical protein
MRMDILKHKILMNPETVSLHDMQYCAVKHTDVEVST